MNEILEQIKELRQLLNSRSSMDISENILLLRHRLAYERDLKDLEKDIIK